MDMTTNSKNQMPKVSIGMPVYNGEKFIRKAVDSLLGQTFTDFELIIADNASTDATGAICKEYALQDSRISYFRHPENLGGANNAKFVFSRAKAKYFMWAACDDMWGQLWLEKCVGILDKNEDVVLVFSNFKVFSHSKGFLKSIYVVPSFGSPAQRLGIRFIDGCSNLFYGVFRRKCISQHLIEAMDFWDIFFGNYMALKGNIHIINDFLFSAGIKNGNREAYSIVGDKLLIYPYFAMTFKLINRKFKGIHRFIMHMFLLYQVICFYKAYRLH